MTDCDLHGAGVLVTRPADQAEGLARAVRTLGGNPVLLPGVEIVECDDCSALSRGLDDTDLVVFVSRNAARIGAARIAAAGGLPARAQIAAVGRGTEMELRKLGLNNVIVPETGHDSDALAACAPLIKVRGKSVLIVRGQGGRERLAEILTRRGAAVRYAECYRREPPAPMPAQFDALWQRWRPAAWTATSAEIVDNLLAMAGLAGQRSLRETPLFVPHARIAARAFSHAVVTIFVTTPGDDGIAAGLAAWLCRLRASPMGHFAKP